MHYVPGLLSFVQGKRRFNLFTENLLCRSFVHVCIFKYGISGHVKEDSITVMAFVIGSWWSCYQK